MNKNNFGMGLVTGALVGTAMGVVAKNLMPKNMDKVKKEAKKVVKSAENIWGNMK